VAGWGGLIFGEGADEICDAWGDELPGPKGDGLGKNVKFFFTEHGWDKLGRKTISACKKHNHRFRIIKVKEASVDVVYKDKFQVAVRFKKKL